MIALFLIAQLAAPASFAEATELAKGSLEVLDPTTKSAYLRSSEKALARAMRACGVHFEKGKTHDVKLVLELDASGRVANSWAQSHKPLYICVRQSLSGATFIKPPSVPYYTSFTLALSR